MHKVSGLFYIGRPNETVSLTTRANNGGQLSVTLDGQQVPANTSFQLPSTSGSQGKLQITLAGPIGASCVVGLAVVDGRTDADFLICQTHTPAPSHIYTFSVAAAAAVTAFANVKAAKPAKKAAAKGRKKDKKAKTTRKGKHK